MQDAAKDPEVIDARNATRLREIRRHGPICFSVSQNRSAIDGALQPSPNQIAPRRGKLGWSRFYLYAGRLAPAKGGSLSLNCSVTQIRPPLVHQRRYDLIHRREHVQPQTSAAPTPKIAIGPATAS